MRLYFRNGSFSTESSNSAYELMSASTLKAAKIARRRNMSRWADFVEKGSCCDAEISVIQSV